MTVLAMKKERLAFRGVLRLEVLNLGYCWRLGHEQAGRNVMGHSSYCCPCSLDRHNDVVILVWKCAW